MEPRMNRSTLGIGMVALGGILLLGQFNFLPEHLFLYLLGLGFIFTYYMFGGTTRYSSIGFLIPGSIILSIAIFADLENWFHLGGWGFFLCLALAFLSVYWFHTRHFTGSWGDINWPLMPAIGLTLFSVFIFLVENGKLIVNLFDYIGYALILFGIYFIWKGRQK